MQETRCSLQTQCSHIEHHRTFLGNKAFEQSCIFSSVAMPMPCSLWYVAESGVQSVECKDARIRVGCRVLSVECKVWNGKCREWKWQPLAICLSLPPTKVPKTPPGHHHQKPPKHY